MNQKNYVCFNLTTETSKYHLDVSQLSDQCFRGFLFSLLSKKSKQIFFRKIFTRKSNLGGDRFYDEQSPKTVVYRIFEKKYSTYQQKRSRKVLNTNYTGDVKI
jgi:hypothetical protein